MMGKNNGDISHVYNGNIDDQYLADLQKLMADVAKYFQKKNDLMK